MAFPFCSRGVCKAAAPGAEVGHDGRYDDGDDDGNEEVDGPLAFDVPLVFLVFVHHFGVVALQVLDEFVVFHIHLVVGFGQGPVADLLHRS